MSYCVMYGGTDGYTYYYTKKNKSFTKTVKCRTLFKSIEETRELVEWLVMNQTKLPKYHRNRKYVIYDLSKGEAIEVLSNDSRNVTPTHPINVNFDVGVDLDALASAIGTIQDFISKEQEIRKVQKTMDNMQDAVMHSMENTDYSETDLITIGKAFHKFRKERRVMKDALDIIELLPKADVLDKALERLHKIQKRTPQNFQSYDNSVKDLLERFGES